MESRFNLDFEKVFPFFIKQIDGKKLSKLILEKVDFTQGNFFTLLPSDAILERLHEFSVGGIMPVIKNELEKCIEEINCETRGIIYNYNSRGDLISLIKTTEKENSEFIYKTLAKNKNNYAIVEDYLQDVDDPFLEIQNVKMTPYGNEVYYLLTSSNTEDEICETIETAESIWHFLMVITTIENGISKILTDEILNEICENVQFIVTSAYDGEGHIFWEKT